MPGTMIQPLQSATERRPVRSSVAKVPIIQTKLYPPRETGVCVRRERLTRLLEQHAHLPLTLVSAPAGYGKSVLVRDWAESQDKPVAWLSLDERDSGLRQFLTCFTASIDSVVADGCASIRESLEAGELPSADTLTNLLLNDLEALEVPCCIVLDDFHRLRIDSPVQQLVDTLLEHPPGEVHLTIVTRRDPPLRLARLRARGAMLDIRQEDLRFTDAELTDFLLKVADCAASERAVANLQKELEGWAAGLRLVSLNLRNVENPDNYLKNLHGDLPVVQEFLLMEALNSQPAEIQLQLKELSVVDRFCAELIDALKEEAGPIGGVEFLQHLQAQNLFTVSLDTHNLWFRFHHLFQELLQAKLQAHYTPEEITALHIRASAWFEAQGLISEAIQHALKAGELNRAADIFERLRDGLLDSERWIEANRILALLPTEIIRQRPVLMLHQAWVEHWEFRLGDVPSIITATHKLLDEQGSDSAMEAELTYFEALGNFWAGDTESALEKLRSAAAGAPENNRILHGEIALYISMCLQVIGQAEQAHLAIADYRHELKTRDDDIMRTRTDIASVFVHLLSGKLTAASFAARHMEVQAARGNHVYEISWARYLKANTDLQSGNLQAALDGFTYVAGKRHLLNRKAALDALSGLALTSRLLNKPDQVKNALEMLHTYAGDTDVIEHQHAADACTARLSLLEGDVSPALAWARSHNALINLSTTLFWICVPAMNQLRIFIASGRSRDLREAQALLETLLVHARALNNDYLGIQLRALGALLAEKQGNRADALIALRGVVDEARADGWLLPFVEPGPVMAELIEQLQLPVDDELGIRIREFFDAQTPSGGTRPTGPNLAATSETAHARLDGLTNRELDILGLLAERLQNKEIAGRLVISTHTVNDHLKHIYQKLNVGNRRHAVRRATQLGLMSDR